jgi:hypothetical protein
VTIDIAATGFYSDNGFVVKIAGITANDMLVYVDSLFHGLLPCFVVRTKTSFTGNIPRGQVVLFCGLVF